MSPKIVSHLAAFFAALALSQLTAATTDHSSVAPAQPPSTATVPTPADTARSTSPAPAGPSAASGTKSNPGVADPALEDAMRAHIRPARVQVKMETPPPPLRPESKPAAPASGMVWVPGHWAPTDGKWQWKRGVWGFPATPISVWIEARYDEKTKQWTAGYWQPDREEPYDRPSAKEAPPPTEKFF